MQYKSVRSVDVKEKRVLVRCDFNVPLDEQGNISDDFRIRSTIPTIEYLLLQQAKIILMSHLGSPGGRTNSLLSLAKVGMRLMEILGIKVQNLTDCVGSEIKEAASVMKPRDILLLENLRFHEEEEANDAEFAKQLASLGEVFVNDAFGACHRPHASIVGVVGYLPSFAGLLLEKEIESLDKLLVDVKRPFVVIMAGKKVETKAGVMRRLMEVADCVLIGHLLEKGIKDRSIDFADSEKIIAPLDGVMRGGIALDIGPKTIEVYSSRIRKAKTILWNGPFGKVEESDFVAGTKDLAEAIINSGAYSVVGGGETVEFVNKYGLANQFSYVSTGGGAMLAYLSGEKLPGLEVLRSL